jgi:hypothetical protein
MRIVFVLVSLLFALQLSAQRQITISGFVSDVQSGEHLYGATLHESNSGIGMVTNSYGFYSLSLPAGKVNLQVSYVGYQQHAETFVLNADTVLSFSLSTNNRVGEVVVKAPGISSGSLHGVERLSMNTVKSLPGFLGENDVLKALTLFPGVQQGQEGSAGIFVRGGSPDQNLILLDGVPVYNASHLFGFVSVFNPEAIQSVDLYKGNFPARFGGRLSSVIDVRMKEGNQYKRHTDLTLGLISSKITHEGPIQKGKSSYIISARRTLLDLVLTNTARISQISSDEKWIPGLSFYDVNAKLNFTLNPTNRLYFSLYNGGDRFFVNYEGNTESDDAEIKDDTKFNLKWGNSVFATRWNRQINPRLFMNASLSAGLFCYDIDTQFSQTFVSDDEKTETNAEVEYMSKVNTNQLKVEFDWYPNQIHKVKFGSENALNYFIPGEQRVSKSEGGETTSGNETEYNFTAGLFAEDHFALNEKWKIDAGIRFDAYVTGTKVFQKISPRLNVDFLLSEKAALSLSWAEMFQPIHLLANSSLGLPSDIWVPATTNTTPEKSSIVSLSGSFDFTPELSLVSAVYYKRMKGVISYQAGYSFMDISEDWETMVAQGKGRSWGFENALNYEINRLKCWANYTLSWNQRQFDEINDGEYFSYKYDRRNDINLGFIWKVAPSVDFSATWVYQTGQAVSVAEQDYLGYPDLLENQFCDIITNIDIDDYDRIQAYSSYNNYRLPAFHHLDLGLTSRKTVNEHTHELKLGIYNVYARQNTYLYYPYTNSDGVRKYKQICIFPFLPSVSYRIIF